MITMTFTVHGTALIMAEDGGIRIRTGLIMVPIIAGIIMDFMMVIIPIIMPTGPPHKVMQVTATGLQELPIHHRWPEQERVTKRHQPIPLATEEEVIVHLQCGQQKDPMKGPLQDQAHGR